MNFLCKLLLFCFQSFITNKLSMRIRQLRLKDNRKSKASGEAEDAPPQKRFRIASTTVGGNLLSEDVYKMRCDEIKAEWNGRRQEPVLRCLMTDTQVNRRNWAKGKGMEEIINSCPPLQFGEYVSILTAETYFSAGEVGQFYSIYKCGGGVDLIKF